MRPDYRPNFTLSNRKAQTSTHGDVKVIEDAITLEDGTVIRYEQRIITIERVTITPPADPVEILVDILSELSQDE